ncbi:MAG: L,D-transpeptidase family protein [Schlesneria sp.]
MFRGYMPALTIVVFGIGIGIGLSWSRGLIPLTLSPAKSGSLSIEETQQEPLPPPNPIKTASARRAKVAVNDAPDDPAVFEQQSEPDFSTSVALTSKANNDINHSHVIPARRVAETQNTGASESWDQDDRSEHRRTSLRSREQSTAELDPPSESRKPQEGKRRSAVTVVAHQDPAEGSNDARESTPTNSVTPQEQLAAAEDKIAAGETMAAHRLLSKLYWNHKDFRSRIQDTIDGTAKTIFFQSQPHFIEPYVIQSGERMEVIAKKYQLSWEYLSKLNRTEPRRIQVGQKLKVVKGPFAAVVELRDFALTIHLQGYYVKRYPVCIGKDGSSPVGKFSVLNKVENPPYTGPDGKVIPADDPSNPLGERWIDLGDSYGIHGTIDPDSIGKAESRGCIRLADREVIEVYNFLVKGSEVVIRK